jgi:selenocysteine lyase/cysteine desulfurase
VSTEVTQTLRERGYWIEEDEWRAPHLFGLRPADAGSTATLSDRLAARDVAVSLRGDAIRVSPHLYNDSGDVEALLDALAL